jgi:hypothetical protein
MRLDEIVRYLCDPENQPHQWVGEERKVKKQILLAVADLLVEEDFDSAALVLIELADEV